LLTICLLSYVYFSSEQSLQIHLVTCFLAKVQSASAWDHTLNMKFNVFIQLLRALFISVTFLHFFMLFNFSATVFLHL